jgi:hypothetical protein
VGVQHMCLDLALLRSLADLPHRSDTSLSTMAKNIGKKNNKKVTAKRLGKQSFMLSEREL